MRRDEPRITDLSAGEQRVAHLPLAPADRLHRLVLILSCHLQVCLERVGDGEEHPAIQRIAAALKELTR